MTPVVDSSRQVVAVDVRARGGRIDVELVAEAGGCTLVTLTAPDALTLADLLTLAVEKTR